MKRRTIATFFMICMLVICMSLPLFAANQDSAGNIYEASEQVSLSNIPFFGAYAMGKEVTIDQAAAKGSVAVIGEDVNIDGTSINESLYAGAQDTIVKKTAIQGNAYLIGETVVLSEDSSCNGAYIMGKNVLFEGKANGLTAAGANVTVKGTINGDATINADKIEIDPGTIVTGTLAITSSEEPVIPETAQIGSYTFTQKKGEDEKADQAPAKKSIFGNKIVKGIYRVIAMAVLGLIICFFFNDHLTRAGEYLQDRPVAYVGKGIAALFLTPILAIILCFTLVLAPVGIITLVLYALMLFAGGAFTGAVLGRMILPNMNVFLSTLIGVIVLQILKLIPFLGWIVGAFCAICILSYSMQYIWSRRMRKESQVE